MKKWRALVPVIAAVSLICAGGAAFAEDYSSAETVKSVQEALNNLGYDCGTPDGVAGQKTSDAIAQFRAAKRLGSGGEIDADLLSSLGLLESALDEDSARAAVVVAFTNRFATDVFTDDGNDYDPEKFHAYGDKSGYYLEETDPGTWTQEGDDVWHGEGLQMVAADFGTEFNVSADVSMENGDYVVSNLSGSAPSFPDVSEIENESDFDRFFVVPASLVNAGAGTEDGAEAASADTASSGDSSGVTPELKEFLDSYEAFMNEYCEFMENYDASDLSQLAKYMELMGKYTEFAQKADAYDENEMSDEDLKYYIDVTSRVEKRLIEAM